MSLQTILRGYEVSRVAHCEVMEALHVGPPSLVVVQTPKGGRAIPIVARRVLELLV